MIEMQPRLRSHFQPPRERLAVLLAQLSELDPEQERRLKLQPAPVRSPEKKLKVELPPSQKLKPEPQRMPAKKMRPKPAGKQKLSNKVKPARAAGAAWDPKSRPGNDSFQDVLHSYLKKQAANVPTKNVESVGRPWTRFTSNGPLGNLARAWSWLQSKYTRSATRRLRLSEVVALGDKRFVALVQVENREFLIGGAASGLSVLAQLGRTPGPAEGRKFAADTEGHAR